jgi:hypothetical protein
LREIAITFNQGGFMSIKRKQAFEAARAWLEDAGEYRAKTGCECAIRTELAAVNMVKAMWPVLIDA